MNNFELHLRLVGLISAYLKLNLAYVGYFPFNGHTTPRITNCITTCDEP